VGGGGENLSFRERLKTSKLGLRSERSSEENESDKEKERGSPSSIIARCDNMLEQLKSLKEAAMAKDG